MSRKAKREYLEAMCRRYHALSTKAEQTELLNQVCQVCGYHRKYVLRRFRHPRSGTVNKSVEPKKRKIGRPKRYTDPMLLECLEILLKASNLVCSKRLKALIPLWLPHFTPSFKISLPPAVQQQLLKISAATIDRLLQPARRRWKKSGLSTTKPGSLIKKQIPILTNQWDERRPGFLEADTVAHCGSSMEGQFVFSLNTVDIATSWIETRAMWGKGERTAFLAIKDIEKALPFPVRGFDSDNGSEFINWHLFKYFTGRTRPVAYTRSRSYQKNDNAHIEGKNWTHIRQYLGYQRFEDPRMVPLLNNLYRNEWSLLFNFFIPSSKVISKDRVGSKIIKRHDSPLTPFQRVLSSTHVADSIKRVLQKKYTELNPFLLQEALSEKIRRILRLASPSVPSHNPLINLSTKKEKK
jgi:hypothetical protein